MKKNKKTFKQKQLFLLIIIVSVILVLLIFFSIYKIKPGISDYIYAKNYNDDKSLNVTLKLKTYNNNKVYCKFVSYDEESKWILSDNKRCTYKIKTGDYKIILKYGNNKTTQINKKFNIDKVISIKINDNRRYVAVGDSFNIQANIDFVGDVDKSITYSSSNPDIVSINENGDLYAHADGDVVIRAKTSNGLEDKFDLTSTSLIRPRVLDNNKQVVGCNTYSKEQVELLDNILNYEVEKAGSGTRAGVVASALFLTTEFPYKIPYFYENGRLSNTGLRIVDGEGRWYHKGLYLGVDKQNEITQALNGPSSWGCSLMNMEYDGNRSPGEYYPNGFDCSGYISWVLHNGGLDQGDIGAGITDGVPDMTDLGELRYINYDLMHSGTVKPGDLIGWDGHIAVIAWINDTSIYVTESLLPGVVLDEYDISSPYSNFYYRYSYTIDMSNQYSGEGNYPIMW